MLSPDVNILIHAHRVDDAVKHAFYQQWFDGLFAGTEEFGIVDVVLSGFLRISTNSKIYKNPSPIDRAIRFANQIRTNKNCVLISAGPRHWSIFTRLCSTLNARGGDVTDAYLAAIAIEHDLEWITEDQGYARWPGLRWRTPTK